MRWVPYPAINRGVEKEWVPITSGFSHPACSDWYLIGGGVEEEKAPMTNGSYTRSVVFGL